ncbi:MAG: helix-turn-helix transcriptional regulator [Ruminococcaceae bacterium]|nr:helix-turn-helix transcriptional regulator [Oscillospiraceae bacterium]
MYKEYDNKLAMKLKMLRLDAGLSQEEFAAKMGISRSCVANYETGKRFPSINMIKKIAEIYGIMTDVLIGNNLCSGYRMCESDPEDYDRKRRKILQDHGNTLDISHLPTEYKISMIEYYNYIQSKQRKSQISEN